MPFVMLELEKIPPELVKEEMLNELLLMLVLSDEFLKVFIILLSMQEKSP